MSQLFKREIGVHYSLAYHMSFNVEVRQENNGVATS